MQVIKRSIYYILDPLVYIINLTLSTGCFPQDLKVALIKPLHKKGTRDDINNYRPIALLPCFSKIFEKVIYNRLSSFLELNNIINKNQFGFQKEKNTSLAIFKMLKQVGEEINLKKPGIALFLDLSKAFDCVDHSILLRKLEHVGIRGQAQKLIESYLQNRTQSTVLDAYNKTSKTIEQTKSKFESISLGVPQGSILGPLLFLIYINDLPQVTKHLCIMFADDATIYIPKQNKNVMEYELEINNTLKTVASWLENINLKVNVDKTKLVQFKNYKQHPIKLEVCHNGSKVDIVSETNFLGVIIDTHLNWKSHVIKVNKKLSQYCYILSVLTNISSKEIAINAYYGYVYPQLNYGIIFWGNSVDIESTFILQKRCLRTIFKLHSTDSLRHVFKNNFLTITDIYILEICVFVKCNKHYFFENKSSRVENLRPKHKFNICIPQINNSMFHKSTFIMAVKIYNNLPLELKIVEGNKFKVKLKSWLMSKCHYNLKEYFDVSSIK